MSEPKKGLGRGLSALLGEAPRPVAEPEASGRRDSVREVEVARIRPNPAQPRQHFDEDALAELAESIRRHGVLQPVLLRPAGEDYELIAGERRWRAAQKAQLHSIPALIREHDDSGSAELALIENVQREDLNAIEEAEYAVLDAVLASMDAEAATRLLVNRLLHDPMARLREDGNERHVEALRELFGLDEPSP